MQAIQRYIHQEVPLVHTQTWQLCGGLQVKSNLDVSIHSDLDIVTNYAESIDDSVIEIGCGTGKNTLLLSQIAENVHAMDFSQSMIEKAKVKLGSGNVNFAISDITKPWACSDQSADLVVCNLVLEHVENLSLIFSEASRCLVEGGKFFVCELHPFRQYQGTKANFQKGQEKVEIPAFVHHISDFFDIGRSYGLTVREFNEWWHTQDRNSVPRLASFLFEK